MLLICYVVADPIYCRNYVNRGHNDVVVITTRRKKRFLAS